MTSPRNFNLGWPRGSPCPTFGFRLKPPPAAAAARADTPEQVLKFVPKERPRSYAPLGEEAGEAIIAKDSKDR
jgi:hypothetical protein